MKYLVKCTQIYSANYVVEASSEEDAVMLLEEALIDGVCEDPKDLKQEDIEVISNEKKDKAICLKPVDVKEE